MHTYKIFNNIAQDGINSLSNNGFKEDKNNPDAILIRSHVLTENDFNKSLKCICRAGAGVNHIPLEQATEKGVVVFNTPGGNANAVKELVICGLLLSSRGIIQGHIFAQSLSDINSNELTDLVESNKKNFKGSELKGKTIGIIGLGAIGSLLAQSVDSMGMKIIGFDPNISIDAAWQLPKEVEKADSLEYLLSNSDYISLHVPLVEETKDLISKNTIKFIKEGAKLINLSRGPIVNNEDILKALEDKKISSFVTDFPTPELVKRSIEFADVILLPHLGASTKEAEINCAIMAAEQANSFLKDGEIINSVNFPRVKLGRTTKNRIVIVHKDEPGVIGNITGEIASHNVNIPDMINKSRDHIAITVIDLDDRPTNNILNNINEIENVLSVRLCK
ncbi:MAG: 3-phosphoglycerate dehydrogenase family protein [Gammaproteobacteria bacterium]|tara:strand:- start:11541 stop:12716 length:1176 start_codon:yes stop_codon:yes gene_type:complete